MAREKFEDRSLGGKINVACKFETGPTRYWQDEKINIVNKIIEIVNSYARRNYKLTLRQLHYQFVGHVAGYVNHDTAYKKLGNILDDCRYAGLIDWNSIEDRGRQPHLVYAVDSTAEALQDTIDYYRRNRQEGQDNIVELWSEKDALSGILKRTTEKYHVRLVVNKGYTSSSAAYAAYRRIIEYIKNGKKFTILYFGDHDPSGLDMVRDIKDRLLFFLCHGEDLEDYKPITKWWEENEYTVWDAVDEDVASGIIYGDDSDKRDKLIKIFYAAKTKKWLEENDLFQVIPIGLTMEQIKKYKLPENPTKLTDSRANGYIKQFGRVCWEVDALSPETLTNIVEHHIQDQIDTEQYKAMLETELRDKEKLRDLISKL